MNIKQFIAKGSRDGMVRKILYYNWCPFDNAKNSGGGVNVYQKNLIEEMIKSPENEIYFLSSGWKYNPLRSFAYLKETKNMFNGKVKSFEIINSPVPAPAVNCFNNINVFLNDDVVLRLFEQLARQYGPFDVIHLNNIEGIPINTLRIKENYPNTKLVLSLHNYVPICPLVQYFQNHNECICTDFNNGQECLKCTDIKPGYKDYKASVRRWLRDKIGSKFIANLLPFPKMFKSCSPKYFSEQMVSTADDFVRYRKLNVEYINTYTDCVLAVSEKVRKIVLAHGMDEKIVKTSYIGTKFAENALNKSVATPDAAPFTICYLGYARIDKGFYFMVDALEKLDSDIASRMKIKLAVARLDKEDIKDKLKNFKDVEVIDGYSHADLPGMLSDVHLGIVPVLWEDNLPQVAIEMVACGVPVLCSDFGGASELCRSNIFKFEGGNEQEFTEKLTSIVKNPVLLNEYWKNHTGLTSMKKHVAELNYLYGFVK